MDHKFQTEGAVQVSKVKMQQSVTKQSKSTDIISWELAGSETHQCFFLKENVDLTGCSQRSDEDK